MRVLVTGGTGTVGSEVVKALVGRDVEVRVLTRDPTRASGLPPGASAVVGDLGQMATIRGVFDGVDAVFLLNAMGPSESHDALMALCGMQLARVPRVVYLSVLNADRAPWLPHFGAKVAVEAALRRSGMGHTILRPNSFFQNDARLKDPLVHAGVYPTPFGAARVARIDVRDIADAAATALLTDDFTGHTVDLVGPDTLTVDSMIAMWSRALNKEIRYGGDDLDAWERQARQFLPEWMAFQVRMMFEAIQQGALDETAPDALERQRPLIGHDPRRYEDFVRELVELWRL
ncbi:MAG: SDR family oxidoreductase [Acidobacteriota bacterium]